MILRVAGAHDVPRLAELYVASVRTLGPQTYTPAQVEAWAAFAADAAEFRRYVLDPVTLVLEDAGILVGFCGVDHRGHVASLYVRGEYGRRGLGSALLLAALEDARRRGVRRFHAEASDLSLPVFLRQGFTHVRTERASRRGVVFERHLVRREDAAGPDGAGAAGTLNRA